MYDTISFLQDVYQCDFLSLKVEDTVQTSCPLANLRSPITRLPSCVFNVIIFCLLLEYFPSCHQRWRCCVQAHKLLAPNGLLLVITPDSHKQHRNSAMIRSWISAITSLGFSKWKYEKLEHIHCIVFRKIQDECSMNDDMADLMFIHQDALEESSQEDASTEDGLFIERNDEQIRQTMLELPGFVSDSEDWGHEECLNSKEIKWLDIFLINLLILISMYVIIYTVIEICWEQLQANCNILCSSALWKSRDYFQWLCLPSP